MEIRKNDIKKDYYSVPKQQQLLRSEVIKGEFCRIRWVIWAEDDLYAYEFYQSASALMKVT